MTASGRTGRTVRSRAGRSAALPAALLAALLVGGCGGGGEDAADGDVTAYVMVPPQAYLAERIGGQRVAVRVLVRGGQSPHTYEPTPRQMAELSQADVLFLLGVPFERPFVQRIREACPDLRLVTTTDASVLRPLEVGHHQGHQHGSEGHDHADHDEHADHDGEGEHRHAAGELDPHVWMSPRIAADQAEVMCDTLCELDRAGASVYRANLRRLHDDLRALDRRLSEALAPYEGQEIFVYHPALGYLARAYGLRQVAIEQAGKEPGAKRVVELIEQARRRGVKVIFVQPQFPAAGAEAVAREIGGAVVTIDPLSGDYLASLSRIAEKVAAALPPTPATAGASEPAGGLETAPTDAPATRSAAP